MSNNRINMVKFYRHLRWESVAGFQQVALKLVKITESGLEFKQP